jgi:hypothetical protein
LRFLRCVESRPQSQVKFTAPNRKRIFDGDNNIRL